RFFPPCGVRDAGASPRPSRLRVCCGGTARGFWREEHSWSWEFRPAAGGWALRILHNLGDDGRELIPILLLGFELLPARPRQGVVFRVSIVVRLRPAGLDP